MLKTRPTLLHAESVGTEHPPAPCARTVNRGCQQPGGKGAPGPVRQSAPPCGHDAAGARSQGSLEKTARKRVRKQCGGAEGQWRGCLPQLSPCTDAYGTVNHVSSDERRPVTREERVCSTGRRGQGRGLARQDRLGWVSFQRQKVNMRRELEASTDCLLPTGQVAGTVHVTYAAWVFCYFYLQTSFY